MGKPMGDSSILPLLSNASPESHIETWRSASDEARCRITQGYLMDDLGLVLGVS